MKAVPVFLALTFCVPVFSQVRRPQPDKEATAKKLCGTGMLKEDVEAKLCSTVPVPVAKGVAPNTAPMEPTPLARDFDKECKGRPSNEPFKHCVDRLSGKPVSDLAEDERKAIAASQAYRARALNDTCQNLKIGSRWDPACLSVLYPGHRPSFERWADGRENISIRTEERLIIYFVDKDGYIQNFVENEN